MHALVRRWAIVAPLLGIAALVSVHAQPYQTLPPGGAPPPPAWAAPFPWSPALWTPSQWTWENPAKSPSILLQLNNPPTHPTNPNHLFGVSQWGVASITKQFSNIADAGVGSGVSDVVLNVYHGGDLILANISPTTEGQTNGGAIRFSTAPPISGGAQPQDLERMTILNNGNVGIGTNQPQKSLHLYSPEAIATFRIQSSSSTPNPRIEFRGGPLGDPTNEWQPGFIQTVDDGGFTGGMEFYTNGSGSSQRFNFVQAMRLVDGRVGIGANPVAKLQVADGSVLFSGTTGATPVSGAGTRMMWIPSKAAFRGGMLESSYADLWNADSIGMYSFAFGLNTRATKESSFAVGEASEAVGLYSMALGRAARATGAASVALGHISKASAYSAFAVGELALASGPASVAIGAQAEAQGTGAISIGSGNVASGDHSITMGYDCRASGEYSAAIGEGLTVNHHHNTALGMFNYYTTPNANDFPLAIGNGGGLVKSNAMHLTWTGDLHIAGDLYESSDARLKHDLQPLGDILTKLDGVQPVYFRFNDTTKHPGGRQLGFLAQEIEAAWPELVGPGVNDYLSVSYSHMSAVAVQAIKELKAVVDRQGATIERLDAENAKLAGEARDVDRLRDENAELARRLRAIEERLGALESDRPGPELGSAIESRGSEIGMPK